MTAASIAAAGRWRRAAARKLAALVCGGLMLSALVGCGTSGSGGGPGSAGATSAPDSEAEAIDRQEDHPPDLPQGDVLQGTAVEYTWDCPVTVDGGRALTLRLSCRATYALNSWRYGVYAIEVLDGARSLQTLSVREARDEAERELGMENRRTQTDCWNVDGDLVTEDLNFDGAEDLRLLDSTGVVNSVYLCWLWDGAAEQFEYAFSLCGYSVELDREAEQIAVVSRDVNAHTTDYYQVDENGVLQLVNSNRVEAELG